MFRFSLHRVMRSIPAISMHDVVLPLFAVTVANEMERSLSVSRQARDRELLSTYLAVSMSPA